MHGVIKFPECPSRAPESRINHHGHSPNHALKILDFDPYRDTHAFNRLLEQGQPIGGNSTRWRSDLLIAQYLVIFYES